MGIIIFRYCAIQWLMCISPEKIESNLVWFVGFIFAVLAALYRCTSGNERIPEHILIPSLLLSTESVQFNRRNGLQVFEKDAGGMQ